MNNGKPTSLLDCIISCLLENLFIYSMFIFNKTYFILFLVKIIFVQKLDSDRVYLLVVIVEPSHTKNQGSIICSFGLILF